MPSTTPRLFSVIIPTMYKAPDILAKLLDELEECECVGEILVIDNSGTGFTRSSSKTTVIIPNTNLYVNPAWNYGVEHTKYPYVAILNDDIITSRDLLSRMLNFLEENPNCGIVGPHFSSRTPREKFAEYPKDGELKFRVAPTLYGFFGAAMFGRRDRFQNIPKELIISYGDHFYFSDCKKRGLTNYWIMEPPVWHLQSLTSGEKSKKIQRIWRHDSKWAKKLGVVPRQPMTFGQKILSRTVYHRHLVYSFLGIKLKIRIKRK